MLNYSQIGANLPPLRDTSKYIISCRTLVLFFLLVFPVVAFSCVRCFLQIWFLPFPYFFLLCFRLQVKPSSSSTLFLPPVCADRVSYFLVSSSGQNCFGVASASRAHNAEDQPRGCLLLFFTVLHLKKSPSRGGVLLWRWAKALRWRIQREGGRLSGRKETKIGPALQRVARGTFSQKDAEIRSPSTASAIARVPTVRDAVHFFTTSTSQLGLWPEPKSLLVVPAKNGGLTVDRDCRRRCWRW